MSEKFHAVSLAGLGLRDVNASQRWVGYDGCLKAKYGGHVGEVVFTIESCAVALPISADAPLTNTVLLAMLATRIFVVS